MKLMAETNREKDNQIQWRTPLVEALTISESVSSPLAQMIMAVAQDIHHEKNLQAEVSSTDFLDRWGGSAPAMLASESATATSSLAHDISMWELALLLYLF